MTDAIFNWSGGKDSSLALYYLLNEKKYNIKYLLTSVNKKYRRISMHGVREELLERQAKEIGIPLHKLEVPEMPLLCNQTTSNGHRVVALLRGRLQPTAL